MRYILDTNFVIALTRRNPKASAFYESLTRDQISFSVITHLEFAAGEAQIGRTAKSNRSLSFFDGLELLPLSVQAAKFASRELIRLGLDVSQINDMAIAATALEARRTVVTQNVKDFKRVARLKVLDWSK